MEQFKQIFLESLEDDQNLPEFDVSANVIKSDKTIIVGRDKVTLDTNKGLLAQYVVRGVNTTGYSSVIVFDADASGFHEIRTNGDYGNATINMTHGGQKGQEIYIKVDNDSDGNKTITFGTPFKVTGTVAGSTSASAVLHFISDGNSLWEVSRTTGINQ